MEHSKRLIEEKAGQLTRSSQYKDEFIASMSHELRSPSNSLLSLAQQLEANPDNNMTADQVQYASVIRQSGMDLLALLNRILDLAKVVSGTATAEYSTVSVSQLGSSLLRDFEPVARGKGLTFAVDMAPNCPQEIVTDDQRLLQVLKHLIGNAINFTYRGSAVLTIDQAHNGWNLEAESLNRALTDVAITVTDSAIGIDLEQHDRIFEPFVQGDASTASVYGGSGLGLSVSRELVTLLGGDITVEGAPGRGSTFTVYLPVDHVPYLPVDHVPAAPAAAVPASRPSTENDVYSHAATGGPAAQEPTIQRNGSSRNPLAGSTLEGTHVLEVDDDYRSAFAMTALLERSGAAVDVAESGPDAIALLERLPGLDVVLMDIRMPAMDGYEAIRAIRARDDDYRALPIIAVTAKAEPGERERCLEAGANDFVLKPIVAAELFSALEPWLPAP